jgi:non-heme chloroperoxidase
MVLDQLPDAGVFEAPVEVHGDDDQIVPIAASAQLSSKLVRSATLKVYKGAPHGLADTPKTQLNEDLLAFVSG